MPNLSHGHVLVESISKLIYGIHSFYPKLIFKEIFLEIIDMTSKQKDSYPKYISPILVSYLNYVSYLNKYESLKIKFIPEDSF